MDLNVMDPIVKQAIAILRGGSFVRKVVLLDENDVVIGLTELPGQGLAFNADEEYAQVQISLVPVKTKG